MVEISSVSHLWGGPQLTTKKMVPCFAFSDTDLKNAFLDYKISMPNEILNNSLINV